MDKVWSSVKPMSAPSDGVFSNRTGQVEIAFPIAARDEVLRASSVRLCGKVRIRNFDANGNSQNISEASPLFQDWRTGIYSYIQSLTIRGLRDQRVLETINSYDQLLSTLLPVFSSEDDYVGSHSEEFLASNDFRAGLNSVKGTDCEQSFAARLYCGLFTGGNLLPLSERALGGLEVIIRLQIPQQALSDLTGTSVGAAGSNGGADFAIINPQLQYEVLRPPMDTLRSMEKSASGNMSYNTITTLQSVVNSSLHSAVFNIASSTGVISTWGKFVPTNHLNNYGEWGLSTGALRTSTAAVADYLGKAEISKLSFFINGQLRPNDFSIRKDTGMSGYLKAQLTRQGLDAIRNFADLDRQLVDSRMRATDDQVIVGATNSELYRGGEYEVIGINLDPFGESGRPMKQESLTIEIESDVGNAFESPNTLFLFLLQRNILQYSQGNTSITN
tara:strand:- start:3552 stop:4889 length:1338 start_codon:yes stop_codon:yes gene_type:complete